MKICYISTAGWPLRVFMGPHVKKVAQFADVVLVANKFSQVDIEYFSTYATLIQVNIKREISPLCDIKALFELFLYLRSNDVDCVHSIMPKAGLLTMLASKVANVPYRFHTFTGQVWATKTGFSRQFLLFLDRMVASFATKVLTDSVSQMNFLVTNKVVKTEKIVVLGSGSIVGVDLNRFHPNSTIRHEGRKRLNIPNESFLIAFIGRLTKDKGVGDLLDSFKVVLKRGVDAYLLIVGDDENSYDHTIESLPNLISSRIHRIEFSSNPQDWMAMADVICLPSYREGFGNVLIESAAVGIPAIASRIYGITDAVLDGVTGILHEPGNVTELVESIIKMACDHNLRIEMGKAARIRAIDKFSESILTNAFLDFYKSNTNIVVRQP